MVQNNICTARVQILFHFVFFLEFVDAAGCIDQLRFTSEKRVAIRTNLHKDFLLRRTRLVLSTARAANHRVFINGMYTCFHSGKARFKDRVASQ